ncbi:alpha-1,2-mannosyltransferase [Actinopolyspora xinjiangensis]|uniref:Alpha-1,2-mannosyltransferase n=1 Tax=Actinopolyspora xinjiangensis TaxID=405564 RepID=A0A1H0WRX2_9ACTN|nr:glycosyltransferase family 87 protein [Actinopolyspora xinjiangensis]SDP93399.1 alpha-1,2-mannosyltransferase [Actinopolyspora xinjiangensis]
MSVAALGWEFWAWVSNQDFWPDHSVYRWAVDAWAHGRELMPSEAPVRNGEPLPWVYPPFAVLPLAPLAVLPLKVDIALLYALNALALSTTFHLVLRRTWPGAEPLLCFALSVALARISLFLEPVFGCFAQGQINILLMGMVVVDCLARHPRWPRGMLVGIAAAIKLVPGVFVLFFLLRKNFRASVTAVGTAFLATLVGFLVDFEASVKYWFTQGPASAAFGSPLRTNQTVLAVLTRTDLPQVPRVSLWLLACAILGALAVYCVRRSSDAPAVVLIGLVSLLVSPTSWSNHWVWLAPLLLFMVVYGLRSRSKLWLTAAVLSIHVAHWAPFVRLPLNRYLMLHLPPVDQVRAASFVFLGAALLVLAAFSSFRSSRSSSRRDSGEWYPVSLLRTGERVP